MLIKVQVFFLFLLAPFIGVILAFSHNSSNIEEIETKLSESQESIQEQNQRLKDNLFAKRELSIEVKQQSEASHQIVSLIQDNAVLELEDYLAQQRKLDLIVEASTTYQERSEDIIELLLATMLGNPIGQTYGENSTVKVYSLAEAGYRGYMAKVRLHNPNAVRMVLAHDKVASQGETTSQAASRTGAILAVNAGGYASQNGQLYPMGITVIDGKVVTFYDTSLSFIGFNQQGNLVGGNITSREQIAQLGIRHGATFLPTLLKDGKKQNIPSKWANTKQPRTLIGHFDNGDLFFMVIDGRREGWSNGVTLEEAQNKLLEFKIQDAYNLDGGGSSTFYYNGSVLNKPSDGRERKVTTNIVIKP